MKTCAKKMFGAIAIILLLLAGGSQSAFAQNSSGRLATGSMKNPTLYSFIYDGRFNRLENDLRFKMALENYITGYSSVCGKHLSSNRVEITKYVAEYRTQTTFLPWGKGLPMPITNQVLEREGYVGTGIYAEPEFARLYSSLSGGYLLETLKRAKTPTLSGVLEAAVGSIPELIEIALDTNVDTNALFSQNGCDSPALKLFSANLVRFAQGQQSLQAANGEKSYFERECETKLKGIFPRSKPASACPCIYRKMSAVLPAKYLYPLEDDFGKEKFGYFLLTSVYRSGLQEEVSACLR